MAREEVLVRRTWAFPRALPRKSVKSMRLSGTTTKSRKQNLVFCLYLLRPVYACYRQGDRDI